MECDICPRSIYKYLSTTRPLILLIINNNLSTDGKDLIKKIFSFISHPAIHPLKFVHLCETQKRTQKKNKLKIPSRYH